jgi:hypothetical protein
MSRLLSLALVVCTVAVSGCDDARGRAERLTHERKFGDLDVKVSYLPWDHFAEREITPEHSRVQKDSIMAHYQKQLYFLVTMTANGREPIYAASRSQAQYSERVQKLSFAAGQFFQLRTSEDSVLSFLGSSFPRLYGASGNNQLLLIYKREPYIDQAVWLDLIASDITFGLPTEHYRFKVSDLERASIHDFKLLTAK